MKRLLLSMIFAFVACIASFAQINDGQLPGSRFRILLPITTSYEGTHGASHSVTAQPLFIYKVPVTKWFAVAGAASYNINNEAFSPKVWLAFSTKRLYILQRNNYDCKTKYYNGGTAMTYKITDNVGIDYTWDNMYASKRWFDYDRLQFVATWRPNSKFNFNAGYSCRHQKGFVANMRYNIKDGIRLQGKVDCGAKNVTAPFPKTYINLWRVGAPLRMSQIFAADTCRSIPKLLVFYPGFYEKLQRRCPNIDIVLLYYDTRLFKSSSQNSKHGVGNDEKTMRAEIRKELLEGKKKGRDDRGFLLACKAWSKTERYSGLNLAVYRHILNMISGGDMKSRTYRAFMIDLNASLRQSCGYE